MLKKMQYRVLMAERGFEANVDKLYTWLSTAGVDEESCFCTEILVQQLNIS